MSRILLLDCEIEKSILGKNETPIPGIDYCEGWRDFKGMGISCIGGWQSWDDGYRVFGKPTSEDLIGAKRSEIHKSIDYADYVITFNGIAFDGPLMLEHGVGIPAEKHVDLLVQIWLGHGLSSTFRYPSHTGFGLDACCQTNGIGNKSGHGAMAPVLWQQKKYCEVIDYCLNDIWLTKELVERCLRGHFVSPKTNQHTPVELPFKSMTGPFRYPTELRAVVDPISPIFTQKYLYASDESIAKPESLKIDPVIKKVFDDINERHREGWITDDEYRKINGYFGDSIFPLPPHLRPENLN